MNNAELLAAIDKVRSIMVAVATGGPGIHSVNDEYKDLFGQIDEELRRRGIRNPNSYDDLWQWYGRWSSGDLPTYRARREYLGEMFGPLAALIRAGASDAPLPTGWARVDRTVDEIRTRLASATTEEQHQAVGLLCREALISLAQQVYDAERHQTLDGVSSSPTDFKRMIEAYIAVEFGGGANKESRKHARSALDLALQLQHERTATFRDAAVCVEATTSVINIIAIVSGRRDPQ